MTFASKWMKLTKATRDPTFANEARQVEVVNISNLARSGMPTKAIAMSSTAVERCLCGDDGFGSTVPLEARERSKG